MSDKNKISAVCTGALYFVAIFQGGGFKLGQIYPSAQPSVARIRSDGLTHKIIKRKNGK
jgi:hypothetical protein